MNSFLPRLVVVIAVAGAIAWLDERVTHHRAESDPLPITNGDMGCPDGTQLHGDLSRPGIWSCEITEFVPDLPERLSWFGKPDASGTRIEWSYERGEWQKVGGTNSTARWGRITKLCKWPPNALLTPEAPACGSDPVGTARPLTATNANEPVPSHPFELHGGITHEDIVYASSGALSINIPARVHCLYWDGNRVTSVVLEDGRSIGVKCSNPDAASKRGHQR